MLESWHTYVWESEPNGAGYVWGHYLSLTMRMDESYHTMIDPWHTYAGKSGQNLARYVWDQQARMYETIAWVTSHDDWVIAQIWMRHVTHRNESCRWFCMAVGSLLFAMLKPIIWVISHKEWVTSHIWMRERSLLAVYDPLFESKNESCHTHMHDRAQLACYVRTIILVMSRIWMSLTHEPLS